MSASRRPTTIQSLCKPESEAGEPCQIPAAGDATCSTRGNQKDSPPPTTRMQVVNSLEVRPIPSSELDEELDRENRRLENETPRDILKWAIDRFGDRFTFATAFGPEGMTIIHYLAELKADVRIFNLDTGYQFPETLELRERVRERYGITVEFMSAETSVEEYERENGGPVYETDPNRCCHDRKVVVLRRALVGKEAWASAIRRDQSPDRAQAPIVGWDSKFSLVKVSPLANWTKADVWKLIVDEKIPYNPLHDQGFPSVGCWPCTRSVRFGEDERAGRWSGQSKTECGLHSVDESIFRKPN